jgi:hypothetical protein
MRRACGLGWLESEREPGKESWVVGRGSWAKPGPLFLFLKTFSRPPDPAIACICNAYSSMYVCAQFA